MNTGTALLVRTPRAVQTRPLVLAGAVVGLALGAFAVGGYHIAAAVEVFMSQLGLFIVIPAATGFLAARRRGAVLAATTVLVATCVLYYLPFASSVASYLTSALVWTVLSLVAGPFFGIAGHALRTDDRLGVLAASGLVGLLVGELARMTVKGLAQGDLDLLVLTLIFDAVSAAVLLAAVRPARRGDVALLAVPMAAVGYLVALALR